MEYPIEVKLLAITQFPYGQLPDWASVHKADGEQLIEYAGRLAWETQSKIGSTPDRIQKWIDIGHLSMVEHASASLYIKCSRVVTHELVRHRIASYTQRSQRYVKENEPRYIMPPEIVGHLDKEVFYIAMAHCWDAYSYLLERGIKPEIARYVLPNACETQIIFSANFREILHVIRLRCCKRALPEFQQVAKEVYLIMAKEAPQVFSEKTCLCYAHNKFVLEDIGSS